MPDPTDVPLNGPPVTIAAIIGSLRTGSHHRTLFEVTRASAPGGVDVVEAPIGAVPLYNQDLDGEGAPPAVLAMKGAVADADGLVIFTPEYNRSVPGVTKNAVDWLSRPFLASPLVDKPVGIVAASPGRGDCAAVREHLAQGVAGAGAAVHQPTLGIASFTRVFVDGDWVDRESADRLATWLDGFLEFVRSAHETDDAQKA